MFRNILLPIDLVHAASWERALPLARELAAAGGGKLHLLAIVPDYGLSVVAPMFPDGFERSVLKRAEADLEAFAAEHAPDLPREQVHLGHGHIVKVIV
jgi:nucleotide-binding universal stress UspA family protein